MGHSPVVNRSVVTFSGARDETGPLTFGQRNVLAWVETGVNKWSSVIPLFHPVPSGHTVTEVCTAIGVLISRHESLRTCYRMSDGEPVQHVIGTGELAVEVCEVIGDDSEFVRALEIRLSEAPFDLPTELPVRAAVVTQHGAPALVVIIFTHMAVDVGSIAVLAAELTRLLAGRTPQELGPPARQPLDQAHVERSPAGARRAEAALRYWAARLAQAPLRLPLPVRPGAPASDPRRARLASPAAAAALGRIDARLGIGRSAIVLAAVAATLTTHAGLDSLLLASVSGNRFQPGLDGYVGSLAQDALISLELDAGTFDEFVRHTWSAQLNGYRHSHFDSTRLWSIMDKTFADRGAFFARDVVFNDVGTQHEAERVTPESAAADAKPADAVEWAAGDAVPVMLFFRLVRTLDELEIELHVDCRYLAPDDVEAVLRGVERLLLTAAAGDVPLAALTELTGVTPVARDEGWVRVGGSWVQPAAVAALLGEAVDRPAASVFVTGSTLVGYVAGYVVGGASPEQVHAACVQALPAHPTAITPTSYVLCSRAPDDPTDLAAWQRQPVIAQGTGRT